MPLAGKDIISDAKGRIQIRPYEFRMTHLGTSQNHACDIWTVPCHKIRRGNG